jgi:CheY-like chemotaxis protein
MLSKGPASGRALRILVVEDNQDVANSLATLLNLWGHDTQVVQEAGAVLSAVQSYRPAVVLMDIGLPRSDGYQIAAQVRQQQGGNDAILVAMTGYGDDEHRRQSEKVGFGYHLVKPVYPDVLQTLLARLKSEVEGQG